MGEGAARRGLGRRHPRPGLGTRKIHPPRWTLGTDTSSQIGGPLARQYRTAQNIWKKRLRISGTHTVQKLLSNGAQVNFRSANGRTALEEAVSRARRRREFLVIRRARPHARESCDSWLPPRPGYSIPCLDCICWSKAVAGSAGPSD